MGTSLGGDRPIKCACGDDGILCGSKLVHLTLTGVRAGLAGCMVNDDGRTWGAAPLPEGHTGVHYAYAPADMVDGRRPHMCGDCVRAFAEAE